MDIGESEADNDHGVGILEQGNMGRISREKMVYMTVNDPNQEDEDMSKLIFLICFCTELKQTHH